MMEEELPPLESVYPAEEVAVHGEDGVEESQEGEGGVARRRGRIRHVRGG